MEPEKQHVAATLEDAIKIIATHGDVTIRFQSGNDRRDEIMAQALDADRMTVLRWHHPTDR